MTKKFREWETTVSLIVDRGRDCIAAFIVLDICIMLMATGICSILGTIIGFIVGMAPYWSEMLLGWFVVYMALFYVLMDYAKYDLHQMHEREILEAKLAEYELNFMESENEG